MDFTASAVLQETMEPIHFWMHADFFYIYELGKSAIGCPSNGRATFSPLIRQRYQQKTLPSKLLFYTDFYLVLQLYLIKMTCYSPIGLPMYLCPLLLLKSPRFLAQVRVLFCLNQHSAWQNPDTSAWTHTNVARICNLFLFDQPTRLTKVKSSACRAVIGSWIMSPSGLLEPQGMNQWPWVSIETNRCLRDSP